MKMLVDALKKISEGLADRPPRQTGLDENADLPIRLPPTPDRLTERNTDGEKLK